METHLEPAGARTGMTVLGREQTSLVSAEPSGVLESPGRAAQGLEMKLKQGEEPEEPEPSPSLPSHK